MGLGGPRAGAEPGLWAPSPCEGEPSEQALPAEPSAGAAELAHGTGHPGRGEDTGAGSMADDSLRGVIGCHETAPQGGLAVAWERESARLCRGLGLGSADGRTGPAGRTPSAGPQAGRPGLASRSCFPKGHLCY